MRLIVKTSGLLATVQDLGRHGFMDQGFGPAGAMDSWSLRAANILVGNSENAPALEFCLVGPSFCIEEINPGEKLVVAFAGAGFQPTINSEPAPLGVALSLHTGDIVAAGNAHEGKYGYLAVRGGIDVPCAFGSAATSLKYHMGGFCGRTLTKNDVLTSGNHEQKEIPDLVLPEWLRINNMLSAPADAFLGESAGQCGKASSEGNAPCNTGTAHNATAAESDNDTRSIGAVTIHAIPNPQERLFTAKGIETFYGTPYAVTPESDRMGLRLGGTPVESINGSDIISDGIPLGAVQIPASGLPIVMMADRQTTGGYAKIATIASADIARLAQCGTDQAIRFVRTSVQQAQELIRIKEHAFAAWANSTASPQQLLDHLQWQCAQRGLPHLSYRGAAHSASVERYAITSPGHAE